MNIRYPIYEGVYRILTNFPFTDGYSNFVSEKKEKAGSGNSFLQSGIAVGIETAHPPCPEVKERQAVWKDERMYMSWFRKGWT